MKEHQLDFISDTLYRNILERDLVELESCYQENKYKSTMILSGSILEGVLFEYLSSMKARKDCDVPLDQNINLLQLITCAKNNDIIDGDTQRLSEVIKNYRNLIHPEREVRKKEEISLGKARIAYESLIFILQRVNEHFRKFGGPKAESILDRFKREEISAIQFSGILEDMRVVEIEKLCNLILAESIMEYYNITPYLTSRYIWSVRKMKERVSESYKSELKDRLVISCKNGTTNESLVMIQLLESYIEELQVDKVSHVTEVIHHYLRKEVDPLNEKKFYPNMRVLQLCSIFSQLAIKYDRKSELKSFALRVFCNRNSIRDSERVVAALLKKDDIKFTDEIFEHIRMGSLTAPILINEFKEKVHFHLT